jgi:thiol-disulfide isomerase/thioredoxin
MPKVMDPIHYFRHFPRVSFPFSLRTVVNEGFRLREDLRRRTMKVLFIPALALLVGTVMFLTNTCLNVTLARTSAASTREQTESSIALMKLPDVEKLREQAHGQVLVINFWATWCHGCVGEFPEIVALDNQYRRKGVKIVGISLDNPADIDSKVTPFIKKSGAHFDIRVADMEDPQPIIEALTPEWTGAMPVTLIFDHNGALAYKRFGVIDREQVVAALERLLKR